MTLQSSFCRLLLAGMTALGVASAGHATSLDVGGVRIEDSLTIYNHTLMLNGAGLVQGGKGPLYVAHIYAKQKFTSLDALFAAPGPKRLTLTAVREVDMAPIVKTFNRSVEATATRSDMAKLIPGLVSIGNMFKTNRVLRPGEVMTLDWVPVYGLIIYIGGKLQGDPLREPELFRAAMGVWMGDAPVDPKLRDALLGHG